MITTVLLPITVLLLWLSYQPPVSEYWEQRDIGVVELRGSASRFNEGRISIGASGDDIWDTEDSFHFVFRELNGDGEIIALVQEFDAADPWAKAGLMIREKLDADAVNVLLAVTPERVTFQHRGSKGASTISEHYRVPAEPRWLKLERLGNTFSAFESTDASGWELVAREVVSMATDVYIGLAVSSHDLNAMVEVSFDDVRLNAPEPLGFFSLAGNLGHQMLGDSYYISPSGNNSNNGRSAATPFRTFSHALSKLRAGDTLILLDGVYTQSSTGLLNINPDTARNGIATAPITLRAQNERQAVIDGEGYTMPVQINHREYWIIDGLTARNADRLRDEGAFDEQHVFRIRGSSHIVLRRVLAYWPNRHFNAQGILVTGSHHVLVEECEVYAFHRHGINAYQSTQITFRRNYVNSRNQADHPSARNRATGASLWSPGGDEGLVFYGTSDSLMENNISENRTTGAQIHGVYGKGQNNRILGHISLNDRFSFWMDTRDSNSSASGNVVRDLVSINAESRAIGLQSAPDVILENISITGHQNFAIIIGEDVACSRLTGGCGFTLRNSLIFNGDTLFRGNDNYRSILVEHNNFFRAGSGSFSAIHPQQGTYRQNSNDPPFFSSGQPVIWLSPDSNMRGKGKQGADIGANVIYRYQDGELGSEPLWDIGTGAFTCGAIYAPINADNACGTVHTRLNVTSRALAEVLAISASR